MKKIFKKSNGFTLAELLIVVAIIAVLVAISIPIFTTQLEKAREATDLSDVRSAYAEVMMAAISEDTTATYSKDPSQTIYKSNGIYSVTVSPLHQEQDNWQSSTDLSIGGVSSTDSTHWIGTPTAKGSCEVSYNPTGDSLKLNWSGKSSGNGNAGSGTNSESGGSSGSGNTPAPNPGTSGGSGNTGSDSTGGNTSGGSGNTGDSGNAGGNTSGGNTSGGGNQGSSGGQGSSGNKGDEDSGQTDTIESTTFKYLFDNGNEHPEKPDGDSQFTNYFGYIYKYNGLLYIASTNASYTNNNNYYSPLTQPSYFILPTGTILTASSLKDIWNNHELRLEHVQEGDIYKDGDNYYIAKSSTSYYFPPREDNMATATGGGLWIKINIGKAPTETQ